MVNSCELGQAKRKLNDMDADAKKKGVKKGGALDGGRESPKTPPPPGGAGVRRNESMTGAPGGKTRRQESMRNKAITPPKR